MGAAQREFVVTDQSLLCVLWKTVCWSTMFLNIVSELTDRRYDCIHTNGAIVMLMLIVETITDGESTIQQVQTLLAN